MIDSFLMLLAVHWFADFVLQTHWQAQNKSKNNEALAAHVGVYSMALFVGAALIFGRSAGWVWFVLVNAELHFVTDYFTSRWSSKLWVKQDWHNFFVVIGLDQLIHQVTLGFTMLLFFGRGA